MKQWKSQQLLNIALGILMIGLLSSIANAADVDVPRFPKELLKEELDNPDIIILDVRSRSQWENSEWKIKGSIWEDPGEFESWANFKYSRNKTLVLSCA